MTSGHSIFLDREICGTEFNRLCLLFEEKAQEADKFMHHCEFGRPIVTCGSNTGIDATKRSIKPEIELGSINKRLDNREADDE